MMRADLCQSLQAFPQRGFNVGIRDRNTGKDSVIIAIGPPVTAAIPAWYVYQRTLGLGHIGVTAPLLKGGLVIQLDMNAESIATMARQGQHPPNWQVHRARSGYFVQQIILALVLLALGVGGTLYLLANPFTAFVPGYGGSETLDPGSFAIARTVDFGVIVIFVAVGLWIGGTSLAHLSRARDEVLVLMPQGFVIDTKTPVAYSYGAMRGMSARNYRGVVTFTITDPTGRRQRLRLDGRFGNASQLAGQVLTMRNTYLRTQAGAQPPSTGQRQPPSFGQR